MAKLPSSFQKKNRTTREFRDLYAKIPQHAQDAVRASCILFDRDPSHKSLRLHRLKENSHGSHEPDSWSISITVQYRAIYVVADGINVWYWIGTHAQYDKFTGVK